MGGADEWEGWEDFFGEDLQKKPWHGLGETVDTGLKVGASPTRVVEVLNEDRTECVSLAVSNGTTTTEVRQSLATLANVDPDKIVFLKQVGSYSTVQSVIDEIASRVVATGVKTFKRPIQHYEHPICIIGAGLGGMQTMIELKRSGRKDFVCIEKLHDFGGHSWITVANEFTKLQTEKATYHVDYMFPDAECPDHFGDSAYPIWPNRDQLLQMFRSSAERHGLYEHTRFGVAVEKVKQLPKKRRYGVYLVPPDSDEPGELLVASAVMAWPGNLCDCNTITFQGEERFRGYIEYASFGKMDFSRTKGKTAILYGHGAFTIENVRTLLEHECKKVMVLCRKRNLCGMKVASWIVAFSDLPVPGTIVLEVFQKMYDLLGFDVWSAHSVRTDAKRSFAYISQRTVFGVTDIYFLAGYYGLMEVIVDEIDHLTEDGAITKQGRELHCEILLKAVGTKPSFKIDKMLGLKELHGLWVGGDPLRPVVCNSMYVEAQNFGSFSSGPGFVTMVRCINWFIDFPDDWNLVKGSLPVTRAGERPAYVPNPTHMNGTFSVLGALIPGLAAIIAAADAMKTQKQQKYHPVKDYLAACKAEWDNYIKFFKERKMIDGRPEPAYPIDENMVEDWLVRTHQHWQKRSKGSMDHSAKDAAAESIGQVETIQSGVLIGPEKHRSIVLVNEAGSQSMLVSVSAGTTNGEVLETLSKMLSVPLEQLSLVPKDSAENPDRFAKKEVEDRVTVRGVDVFRRPLHHYDFPICIIGAGLGGMQTMLQLKQSGRKDFICLEKLEDFGGHSWLVVSNKFTKLQTEKATYHVDYLFPESECPDEFENTPYPTWPSRDELLQMFRVSAQRHGLYEHTRFGVEVQEVRQIGDKQRYSLSLSPTNASSNATGELLLAGAVVAWPGNLCLYNEIAFEGEDQFDGYIEYSSFGKMDYARVENRVAILYGHGAFTIENVRTFLEHRCKKVFVLCRKRNLSGNKVASWLVAYSDLPVPSTIVLEIFQQLYNLVGFDVWTAHSVKSDANRSYAHISQKTVFGVTDVYFIAAYYGLMEVIEDEIHHLEHHRAVTKKGKQIDCEVLVKAVGTRPDFGIDKMLGLEELHGMWINGDPLRAVACNGMFVEAQNFGSFSSGPAFVSLVKMITWFLDFPEDWRLVKGKLPVHRAGDRPAYVPNPSHLNSMFSVMGAAIPQIGFMLTAAEEMKTRKQRKAHPIPEYLAACKAEWDNYIRFFKENHMVTDAKPEPVYPYTEQMVEDWIRRTRSHWQKRMGGAEEEASTHPTTNGTTHPRSALEIVNSGVLVGPNKHRSIQLVNEGGTQALTMSVAAGVTNGEVLETLSKMLVVPRQKLSLVKKVGSHFEPEQMEMEVTDQAVVRGIEVFRRPVHQYDFPICIIGGGLGGMQTMLQLKQNGRKDFVCFEKLDDFGGHSWLVVSNKFTKLQTEKATYHVDYLFPDAECPDEFENVAYPTWPSRDELLQMFRVSAERHGLYEHTRFGVSVTGVGQEAGKSRYMVSTVPAHATAAEPGETVVAGAVLAWPGNLCLHNEIQFEGEDKFDGYIEYSSFGKMDYTRVTDKVTILYGHGAFTIENVRTFLEHRCKKVFVLCRKRNLSGNKVASWLVAYSDLPVPSKIVLEVFQKLYDLVGFDVWTAHSVKTDAKRSFAHISQKTVFGVTDVYFIAAYYGLMEVIEDEIHHLEHHRAVTKKGRNIDCEVLVKAVGTRPDFNIDKTLGIQELHGLWVNGDPLRSVACNGMFVEAQNFGSFSSGPAFVSLVKMITWFVDFPEDWKLVKGKLPVHRAGDRPAYVPSPSHLNSLFTVMGACIPQVGYMITAADEMKTRKQRKYHPIPDYLAACKAEWDNYIRFFKENKMTPIDKPPPAYPYNEELVQDWIQRTREHWLKRAGRHVTGES